MKTDNDFSWNANNWLQKSHRKSCIYEHCWAFVSWIRNFNFILVRKIFKDFKPVPNKCWSDFQESNSPQSSQQPAGDRGTATSSSSSSSSGAATAAGTAASESDEKGDTTAQKQQQQASTTGPDGAEDKSGAVNAAADGHNKNDMATKVTAAFDPKEKGNVITAAAAALAAAAVKAKVRFFLIFYFLSLSLESKIPLSPLQIYEGKTKAFLEKDQKYFYCL